MSWFADAFGSLPDPRTGNAKRHDLLEILTIALTANSVWRGVVLGFRRLRR